MHVQQGRYTTAWKYNGNTRHRMETNKRKTQRPENKEIRNSDLTKHRYSGQVSKPFGFMSLLFTENWSGMIIIVYEGIWNKGYKIHHD